VNFEIRNFTKEPIFNFFGSSTFFVIAKSKRL